MIGVLIVIKLLIKKFKHRFQFHNIKFSQIKKLDLETKYLKGIIFDLGYSTYQKASWENPFGGFNGHTDAMPGGNYASTTLNTDEDRLLFLNRGYCPTRYYEDGASRSSNLSLAS